MPKPCFPWDVKRSHNVPFRRHNAFRNLAFVVQSPPQVMPLPGPKPGREPRGQHDRPGE